MLGDIEPSDEMCEWPSDTEDEDDDDLADEAEEKLKKEQKHHGFSCFFIGKFFGHILQISNRLGDKHELKVLMTN